MSRKKKYETDSLLSITVICFLAFIAYLVVTIFILKN